MTYPELVKAEVARRYGVPVLCEVQMIPRGVSGLWVPPPPALPPPPPPKAPRQPGTPRFRKNAIPMADQEEIFRLHRAGVKLTEIARRVGRSKSLVHRYLN